MRSLPEASRAVQLTVTQRCACALRVGAVIGTNKRKALHQLFEAQPDEALSVGRPVHRPALTGSPVHPL